MAILFNINGLFAIDSTGAMELGGAAGASTYVLMSNGAGNANSWYDVQSKFAEYLPLTGGTLTGNLALTDATNNPSLVISTGSLTVGGATTLSSTLTISGRATFPSAVANRPQLPGGFLGLNTGDGNFDIWGISTQYYPSHATAGNAWGLQWNGDTNQFRFVGGGQDVVTIDLDQGNFVTTGSITGTTATFSGLVSGITPTAAANFATKDYVDNNAGTTYTAGNGITFTGTPATVINADINYISYSGTNNFIVYGTQNNEGTTIPTGSQIIYADASGTQIVSRGFVSDLPFTNNTGDITAVIAGTDLSGGGTSGSVTLNNTSTLATVTGRGASTGTSTTFGSTGVNTKLRVVDTTYYTSPTYSWTNSAIQTTSIEIIDATTDNANVCATLVMHNYGDGGVKFRMGNTGDKTLYLSSGQSAGAGNPTDDNSGTYFDEMKINNAVVYHTGNLPSGSGVTSVATGTGLTGGTITTTGTLSIDSTVATLAGQQVFTGNKYFNNFFLEFNSKTLANFNDLNNNQFDVSMYDVYNLATASTGMLSTYGTLFQINGRSSHTKTQFAFNGGNDNLQYRTSWYPDTAWTSFRQIWDSDNLPNPTQGGPYLPLTGGTVTGLTNLLAGSKIVVQNSVNGGTSRGIFMWNNTDANWGIYMATPGSTHNIAGGAAPSGLNGESSHSIRFRIASGATNGFIWENSANATLMSMNGNSGNLTTSASMRSQIFYDSLNTAYYIDPSSDISAIFAGSIGVNNTSPIVTAWGTASNTKQLTITGATYGVLNLQGSATALTKYSMGVGNNIFHMAYDNIAGRHNIKVNSSGNVDIEIDVRAPFFYDKNNTAYFGKFSSYSSMRGVAIRGDLGASDIDNQIFFYGTGGSTTSAIGFKNGGQFANPTGSGDGWNTLLTMDTNGRGWVFRRGTGGSNFTSAFNSGWILNDGNWQANTSMRAPIFYDKDNTTYYTNPAGISNIVSFHANGNSLFNNDNHLTFGPNSSWGSSLRIGGNGRTATGTEMASIVTTDGNIHLDAANSSNGIYLNYYAGTNGTFFGTGASAYVAKVESTGSAKFPIYYEYSNTAYYLDPAGTGTSLNVAGTGIFAGDVVAYSDKKLKTNIKTLDGSKVLKMRGVSFDRIDTGNASSGVIAQEIQEIAPELVNDKNGTLAVAYGNLTGYLIEAIKKQQKQIDELTNIIKKLK